MNKPTKVTKVLIHKIHGGRKQDSKFWQSEFDNKPIDQQPKIHNNKNKYIIFAIFVFFCTAFVFASPKFAPYIANYFFPQPDLSKYSTKTNINNYKNNTKKYVSFSGRKKRTPS